MSEEIIVDKINNEIKLREGACYGIQTKEIPFKK